VVGMWNPHRQIFLQELVGDYLLCASWMAAVFLVNCLFECPRCLGIFFLRFSPQDLYVYAIYQ
jgi:hypothetical protein